MTPEGVSMLAAGLDTEYWSTVGHGVSAIALYTIVGVALVVLGFFVIDWTTPGPLRTLVMAGRPNAAAIAAAGVVSVALIVVLTIYSSSGDIIQGLVGTLIFGVLGLVGQALCVRLIGLVTGIDIGRVLAAERFVPEALVIIAGYVAFGLIIAIAIL
jgi:uncharacterized membrane protein YjfL (UPF0719 family)